MYLVTSSSSQQFANFSSQRQADVQRKYHALQKWVQQDGMDVQQYQKEMTLLHILFGSRWILSFCKSVNLIIEKQYIYIHIATNTMNKMISTNRQTVTITDGTPPIVLDLPLLHLLPLLLDTEWYESHNYLYNKANETNIRYPK